MKKLWSEEKYKRAEARRRHKAERRGKGSPKKTTQHKSRTQLPPTRLFTPEQFSLITNPEDTVKYLQACRVALSNPLRDLIISFANAEEIDPEAIAALVSTRHSIAKNGVTVVPPSHEACRKRLNDFGFFQHIDAPIKMGDPTGLITSLSDNGNERLNIINSGKKVDSITARDIIAFGVRRLKKGAEKHGPSYSVFNELMANTFQHAGQEEGDHKWWAGVFYDNLREIVCFTCVDSGSGILKSHNLKPWWLETSTKIWSKTSDADKLEDIVNGRLPSRTGMEHRGKGLPNMRKMCKNGRLRNLTIVTNKVRGCVAEDEYQTLRSNFRGTLVPHIT